GRSHGTSFGHLEVLDGVAGKNPSPKVNLFEDFTGRLDIAGALGSAEIAMYLYDLEPGESFPYHYEYVQEWLLFVHRTVALCAPPTAIASCTVATSPAIRRVRKGHTRSRIEATGRRGFCCSRRRRFRQFRSIRTPTRSASGPTTTRSTTSSATAPSPATSTDR